MRAITTAPQDKQADALRERLVGRLAAVGAGPREWRLVAWCIGQLGYSEKGLRRLMELTAAYRCAAPVRACMLARVRVCAMLQCVHTPRQCLERVSTVCAQARHAHAPTTNKHTHAHLQAHARRGRRV
jgi:hypothetical protein